MTPDSRPPADPLAPNSATAPDRPGGPDPRTGLDERSPLRFLWSLARQRPMLLACTVATGSLWMLPTALMPLVIGRAIDSGIRGGPGPSLPIWIAVILLLGLVQSLNAAGLTWTAHTLWLHGTGTTQRVVTAHIAGLGATLTRKVRSGEVIAVGSADVYRVGKVLEILGRTAGSVVSFLVATGVTMRISPLMGVVVLIGVPVATLGIGPLLAPLRRREEAQREQLGRVSGSAADIVSGLRILRGIGGESRFHARFTESSQLVRRAGVESGRVQAWLAGAEVLLPGLVTVLVTWLGARLALSGAISVGELVAFYGVSAFLVIPVRTATEAASTFASGLVAAGRACALLRLRPQPRPPADPVELPRGPLSLHDGTSGLRVAPGGLTVIDANGDAEALARRLSGNDADAHRVLAGGVPLNHIAPEELRRRVVLAHSQDVLFSGPLRAQLDLGTAITVDTALHAADAHDVVAECADDELDERARSLSGGQRQRLMLARALCADADVLVLDDPTSAVDAHTEARIARRLRELRDGRTTVVLSQSPLWTAVADQVEELR